MVTTIRCLAKPWGPVLPKPLEDTVRLACEGSVGMWHLLRMRVQKNSIMEIAGRCFINHAQLLTDIAVYGTDVWTYAGGGPKRLRVLLEGESLLNDASSFTLFTIFLEAVVQQEAGHLSGNGWSIFGQVIGNMCKLAAGMPFSSSSLASCHFNKQHPFHGQMFPWEQHDRQKSNSCPRLAAERC